MADTYQRLVTDPTGGALTGSVRRLVEGQQSGPGYVRPAVGQQWPMPNNPQASS